MDGAVEFHYICDGPVDDVLPRHSNVRYAGVSAFGRVQVTLMQLLVLGP
jgi:hypothetical protein